MLQFFSIVTLYFIISSAFHPILLNYGKYSFSPSFSHSPSSQPDKKSHVNKQITNNGDKVDDSLPANEIRMKSNLQTFTKTKKLINPSSQYYALEGFLDESSKDFEDSNDNEAESNDEDFDKLWDNVMETHSRNQKQSIELIEEDEIDNPANKGISEKMKQDHMKELGRLMEEKLQTEWDQQNGVTFTSNPQEIYRKKFQADQYVYEGTKQFRIGNYSEAFRLFSSGVQVDPMNGRGWSGLAKIHWKRRAFDDCETVLKTGLTHGSKNAYLWQHLACVHRKLGRVADAKKSLKQAIRGDPRHVASWIELASLHTQLGDVDAARECYQTAMKSNDGSYVVLNAWGTFELRQQNYDLARDLLEKCIQLNRKSLHAFTSLSKLETMCGNMNRAEEILQSCGQNNSRLFAMNALLREKMGDEDTCRSIFEANQMAASRHGDAGYFQSWGEFESRCLNRDLGMYSRTFGFSDRRAFQLEAQLCYSNASSLILPIAASKRFSSPVMPIYRGNKAPQSLTETKYKDSVYPSFVQYFKDKIDFIRHLYMKAIGLNQYHSHSWIAWANFELKIENYERAKKILISGISKFPNTKNIAWFHSNLGKVFARQGDPHTARACYQRSLSTSPPQESWPILEEYARMEMDAENYKLALNTLELAMKRFPREERIGLMMERVKEKMRSKSSNISS